MLELTLLSLYYLPWLWRKSETLTQYLAEKSGWFSSSEIPITIAFFLLDGVKDTLISLPFSLYHTFVLEQHHGFNKQNLMLFVLDFIKSVRPTLSCIFCSAVCGELWQCTKEV